jgi:hypothetical protein
MPKQKDIRSRGSAHVHPCHGYMFARLGPPDDPIGMFLGRLASLHIHLYAVVHRGCAHPKKGASASQERLLTIMWVILIVLDRYRARVQCSGLK